MGLFSRGPTISTINFVENRMEIDGHALTFPLSLAELEAHLGKPSRTFEKEDTFLYTMYVYDSLGLVFAFNHDIGRYFKRWDVYIDEAHKIQDCYCYFGAKVRPIMKQTPSEVPKHPCKAKITFEGFEPSFISDRQAVGDFKFWLWPCGHGESITGTVEPIPFPMLVSYSPKPQRPSANYKLKNDVKDALHFEHLNFKLAVIQVLMYDLEVLEPYFDLYDFADQYRGKPIDTESESVIRPVLNFFKKLPIPAHLAEKVETITMDGGNEIYGQLCPQWDGEDDRFDIDEVTLEDIRQFPNLKRILLMSESSKVKAVFEAAGIVVEHP